MRWKGSNLHNPAHVTFLLGSSHLVLGPDLPSLTTFDVFHSSLMFPTSSWITVHLSCYANFFPLLKMPRAKALPSRALNADNVVQLGRDSCLVYG